MAEPISAPIETKPIVLADPHGRLQTVDASEAQRAIQEGGYTIPDPAAIQAVDRKSMSGNVGQQVLTGVEGAASAATFGGSTAFEIASGLAKPQEIRQRREENPISHMVGQGAGLIGSSLLLPGGGAAGVLERAGQGVAEAAGLGAAKSIAPKIGSMAIKAATENALFQAGDEASKAVSQTPDQSVQTALTNIGLSGLIGGGVGAGVGTISPLWKATMGPKVGSFLKAMSDKAGGIEGVVPEAMHEAIQTTGMEVAPEIKAALSQNPEIQKHFQILQESMTSPGLKAQEALKTFKSDATNSIISALGKTPEEVEKLSELSHYDLGNNLKNTMVSDIKSTIDPLSERFNEIKGRFAKTEIEPGQMDQIADKLGKLSLDKGYELTSLSPEASMINQIVKEMPNIKNLEELTKYQSAINRMAQGKPELFDFARNVRNILRDAESDIISSKLANESPELLDTFSKSRSAYQQNMSFIDQLNDRLHVGKYSGPESFVKALSEMRPEDLLRRMEGKRDAELLQNFLLPEWEKQIKDYHLSQVLKTASQKAGPGEIINAKHFFNSLDKMSPELKQFALPAEAMPKIEAIQKLLDGLPSKINTSGTAKTIDALWSHVPGTAVGMATWLIGHNPVAALILGPLTNWISRDVPDAVRLGMLKFLGSGKEIDSEGFKAMVDFIQHTIKGENLVSKASKAVFKSGQEVLPQTLMPSDKSKKKLDDRLLELKVDPSPMLDMGGKMPHYMPDHGQSMGQVVANATNYLNSLRPSTDKKNPLDGEIKLSAGQKAQYDRALTIAEQPLVILKNVKEGTVTPQDLAALSAMYPALKAKLDQRLTDHMVDTLQKGGTIPYKTRMGLSMFLGQALDSTMTPQSILASQPKPGSPQAMKKSMNSLDKIAPLYQTAGQASEAHNLK